MSVYLNGVDITATAGALVIHDTDIKADLGDYSGQENLQTLLAALGIPDVTAKGLYTCLVTDRLDNATYGLSALDTDLTTIINDLANGTDGLGALKTLLVAIPTTMVGTDDAALASVLGALNTATKSGAIDTETTVMGYTKQAIDLLEHIDTQGSHVTTIFPAATNLDCVLTAHATANVWSAYTEIADTTGGTPITLSSLFAALPGHITAMVTESANTDDTVYMVEVSYGESHQRISAWRLVSGTNKVSSTGQSAARGAEIPAGETIYYRCMCETASSKTLNVHFRYYLHS